MINYEKIIIAIFFSLFKGFVGLIVGVFIDESFGGMNFEVIPYVSIVFVIVTMGALTIYFNEKTNK